MGLLLLNPDNSWETLEKDVLSQNSLSIRHAVNKYFSFLPATWSPFVLSPASDLGIWELRNASNVCLFLSPWKTKFHVVIRTVQSALLVTSCCYTLRSLVQTGLGTCRQRLCKRVLEFVTCLVQNDPWALLLWLEVNFVSKLERPGNVTTPSVPLGAGSALLLQSIIWI